MTKRFLWDGDRFETPMDHGVAWCRCGFARPQDGQNPFEVERSHKCGEKRREALRFNPVAVLGRGVQPCSGPSHRVKGTDPLVPSAHVGVIVECNPAVLGGFEVRKGA